MAKSSKRKNPHAVALGRKGGRANTAAQKTARRKKGKGKGVVGRKPVLCESCGKAGRAHWWYRGIKRCPPVVRG